MSVGSASGGDRASAKIRSHSAAEGIGIEGVPDPAIAAGGDGVAGRRAKNSPCRDWALVAGEHQRAARGALRIPSGRWSRRRRR